MVGDDIGDAAGSTVAWRELLHDAERQLRRAGVPEPEVSARRMVEEASGAEGAAYVLALDEPATVRSVAYFDGMLARRLRGEPLQYVLGRWGFRGLDLMVDDRALIPRPETEQVVEVALDELDRLHATDADRVLRVVDLGTGSGAIALAVAAERRFVEVWATDVSADALAVASANLAGIGRPASRVRMSEGAWFAALPADLRGDVDAILSNPPYIAVDEELPAEVVAWEPREALIAGPSGLEAFEAIFAEAGEWLRSSGIVVLELAPHQVGGVDRIASNAGFAVTISRDLSGRDRVARARRP